MKKIGESSSLVNTEPCTAPTVERFWRADQMMKARRHGRQTSRPVLQDPQAVAEELHLVHSIRIRCARVKPKRTSLKRPSKPLPSIKVNKTPRQVHRRNPSHSDPGPTATHRQPRTTPKVSVCSRPQHNNQAELRPHHPETHLHTKARARHLQMVGSLQSALAQRRVKPSTQPLASTPPLLFHPL